MLVFTIFSFYLICLKQIELFGIHLLLIYSKSSVTEHPNSAFLYIANTFLTHIYLYILTSNKWTISAVRLLGEFIVLGKYFFFCD